MTDFAFVYVYVQNSLEYLFVFQAIGLLHQIGISAASDPISSTKFMLFTGYNISHRLINYTLETLTIFSHDLSYSALHSMTMQCSISMIPHRFFVMRNSTNQYRPLCISMAIQSIHRTRVCMLWLKRTLDAATIISLYWIGRKQQVATICCRPSEMQSPYASRPNIQFLSINIYLIIFIR